ncbi:MAG: hypothetical protein KBT75_12660 [Oleispira antarctica]|nr:hypothetical protein [Oleispira antarctica]MBQ0793100.1 hypothetical protein [Oleispira antarctica]
MELNLRTVLVILGSIVMLGILVDGFRRMRRARQDALSIDVKGDFKFPEENFSAELPNGGARVIGEVNAEELLQDTKNFRDQLDGLPVISALDTLEDEAEQILDDDIKDSMLEERIYAGEPDFQHDSYAHNKPEVLAETAGLEIHSKVDDGIDVKQESKIQLEKELVEDVPERKVPKAKPLNLDEHVPLLMDVEELGDDVAAHEEPLERARIEALDTAIEKNVVTENVSLEGHVTEHVELTVDDVHGIQASVADMADLLLVENTVSEDDSENSQSEISAEKNYASENSIPEAAELEIPEEEAYSSRQQAEDMATQAAYAPVKKPGINAEILSNRPVPGLMLVTHVTPHDKEGFCGEDILYLVNSCDLRHGEKGIFHRFEEEGGEGCIEFSMANSFNPGTFDPETLLHERIYGVSLFMSLPGPVKAMNAFESMTEMASVIARNLGGDVHDETHSIMALQTIEHNRQLVRDFVRKQKLTGKK